MRYFRDDFFVLISRVIAVSLLLLTAIACEQNTGADQMLADYQQRVIGLTDVKASPSAPIALPSWPAKRDRVLPVVQQRTSVAEWFRLRHCSVFELINERNSILGRVQQPSQRLLYEVEFLSLAKACVAKLSAELAHSASSQVEESRNQLLEVIRHKQASLPAVLWNSSVAGEEFAAMVSLSLQALPLDDGDSASIGQAALLEWKVLHSKAVKGELPSAERLEKANQALDNSRWLGQLYRGQQLVIYRLQSVAEVLEKRLQKPLCFNNKPNRKSRDYYNVFQRYYAGSVQPYMATLKSQQRQAATMLDSLLLPFENRPQAVEAWVSYYQQTLQLAFDAAIDRHTKAWQKLLGQCGLMPGMH